MELLDYDGVPTSPWVDYDTFKQAITYQPKESDVFVAAFPKSGSTWIQYIVHEILNDCCEPPFVHEIWWNYGPVVEKMGFPNFGNNDGMKRHLKTHLPFNLVPYSEKAKYIYVSRNPWDACVSGYNMLAQLPECNAVYNSFDHWFNDCIAGRIENGSYFSHVSSWLNQKEKKNILLLTYEETKHKTKETILTIAKFLGDQYFAELNTNEENMAKILKYTSFDYMKRLPFVCPIDLKKALKSGTCDVGKNTDLADNGGYVNIDFFKKGKVGYTKQHYSDQQKDVLKEKVNKHFNQFPDLMNVWKKFGVEV